MKIGGSFKKDGQRYTCVGVQGYVSRFGHKSKLIVLQTRCADCGEPFRFMTTAGRVKQRVVNRRCEQHKSPGRRVRSVWSRSKQAAWEAVIASI